ncbi:hypothetical protein Taro_046067 [Colocasia esculenta]|uniref:Uncharacterized protein n=1 Tax=Colocasia esculenta TaxID=4460 RepID=A0A843WYG4_COLES|nr:hypothetical protein [Colocasia esculenta]
MRIVLVSFSLQMYSLIEGRIVKSLISGSSWAMLCNLIFRIFLEIFTEVGFYLICFLEGQTFSAKVVSTQPSLVSTQWFRTKAEM